MGTLTVAAGNAFDPFLDFNDWVGTQNLTPTSFRIDQADGSYLVVTGTGFTYDIDGLPLGTGEMTGATLFSAADAQIFALTGISVQMANFVAYYAASDEASFLADLFDGADTITGAELADTLVGFDGDDTLTGNGGDDALEGGVGLDWLYGGLGNDGLWGGEGNDSLDGGTGGDSMFGGVGDDTYIVDSAADVADETGGSGLDTVQAAVSHTLGTGIEFGNITTTSNGTTLTGNGSANTMRGNTGADTLFGLDGDDTLFGGSGASANNHDYLDGGAGNDTILGLAGNDTMFGGVGDDSMSGATGNDTMFGGAGNDTYILDAATDVIDESSGSGIDFVQVQFHYTLGADFENGAVINAFGLTGNASANTLTAVSNGALYGLGGDDTLLGGDGANILDGGAGNDTMVGGDGSDQYFVDSASDVVTETGGPGVDAVYTTASYTIASGVEDGYITTGASGITLTGNGSGNRLSGSTGDDSLVGMDGDDSLGGSGGVDRAYGGSGNDTLDGGTGDDSMYGGTGDDTFIVDGAGDVASEDGGSGNDIVLTSVSYVLGAGIERATITSTASGLTLTGNGSTNTLTGGTGNDSLIGLDGDDNLAGLGGTDRLYGGIGNDTLFGEAADDTLDGGAGNDTLVGGAGNDTYDIDSAGDISDETGGSGVDLVRSTAATYTLGSGLENAIVVTASGVALTGNSAVNTLTGADGADTLDGAAGNDTLVGGGGGDSLFGGNDDDSMSGGLAGDALSGGSGNDVLDGGGGDDSLSGGAGNDTYFTDSTGDVVDETGGSGIDLVVSSVDHTLAAGVENGTVIAVSGATLTGNDAANTLTGGEGADVLAGGTGIDALFGGGGNDTLVADGSDTTVIGGDGVDTALYGNAADTVTGAHSIFVDHVSLGGGADVFAPSGPIGYGVSVALSALDGTTGFRVTGTGGNWSVSSAGDVNGDGVDDMIVGSLGANASYVVFGHTSGWTADVALSSLDGATGFRLSGVADFDYTGISVSSAGDVNGDGFDDLIVGAPGVDLSAGAAYVVFGHASGWATDLALSSLDGVTGFRLSGVAENDSAGWSVSSAGDVNGDGLDDLLVGATNVNGDSGASYVVFGRASGWAADVDLSSLNGVTGFRLTTTASIALLGSSVSSAGDVNGDGLDDLIVSAPAAGGFLGVSYVVFGRTSGWTADVALSSLNGTNGFQLTGPGDAFTAGRSVSSAGDVNGDGFDDLIIGAGGVTTTAGANVYVVFGRASGWAASVPLSSLDGATGFRLTGEPGFSVGVSVSSAGDLNGDGFDDLIVGTYAVDGPNGRSYVVFGHASGWAASLALSSLDGESGFRLTGAAGSYSGYSVSSVGDVNGDGFDDLMVGALEGPQAGYVVFGGVKVDVAYTVDGGAGDDTIAGEAGDDSLDGGTGNDTLAGAAGNDTYVVDSAGDVVDESGGSGNDLVRSMLASYTLTAGVENGAIATGAGASLTGNGAANILTGGAGVDVLDGAGGNDTLLGGLGGDSLFGGEGNDRFDESPDGAADTMNGGYGDDFYILREAGEIVDENSPGTAGLDTVWVSFTNYTLTTGTEVGAINFAGPAILTGEGDRNTLFGEASQDTLFGLGGSDYLYGFGADDTLYGGLGPDFLYGGSGNDTLVGGEDNDYYRLDDAGADTIVEVADGGIDQVWVNFSGHTMQANVEWGVLNFDTAGDLTGNAIDNTLYGTDGVNTLMGGGGNDNLLGYAGIDVLHGEDGDDALQGGLDADTLYGGTGNDAFIGGGGAGNTYFGGAGDDFFRVDAAGDVVSETGGSGIDTVWVSVTVDYVAPEGIENLAANIGTALNLTGNALDNFIQGNDAVNTLSGAAGNDTLIAYDGNDVLVGGAGRDILIGGGGADTFAYGLGDGNDVIVDFNFADGDRIDLTGISYIGNGATSDVAILSADGGVTTFTLSANNGYNWTGAEFI